MEAVGDGFTWRRAASSLELDEDTLDDQMRDRIASGVRTLKEDAFVKAGVLARCKLVCVSMCASQYARARGQRPAFGRKGFPHSPPLWHGKRQC